MPKKGEGPVIHARCNPGPLDGRRAHGKAWPDVASPSQARGSMPSDLPAPTIYVVDDDPVVLAFLQAVLAARGFVVEGFSAGEAMLATARTLAPALFVLDIRLPASDGIELVRTLRSIDACAKTPVLMLTGEGRLDRVVLAIQAGADDYLMKPFPPEQLNAKVDSLLRR
jgi:DNA-binding response OmpR family regulator